MSHDISRYPGNVPMSDFINYDKPTKGERVNFLITGKNFDQDMSIRFWDCIRDNEIDDVRTQDVSQVSHVAPNNCSLQGSVKLPGRGMYQLILQNPGVPKHAQPVWIYWSGYKKK